MSDNTIRKVLVVGGTGRFAAIVEILLAKGHGVRATTRSPHSPAAERLRSLGAEVVHADFDAPETLARAATGVNTVFASGTAHRAGPDGEIRHGRNLASALADANVAHLVFVSGAGAHAATGVPVLDAKHEVERAIDSHRIPATIIAPVYFMENLFNPWNRGPLRSGRLPTPLPPSTAFQQVAIADVLALAATAIDRPTELAGERIEVAGHELNGWDAAATLSRLVGRTLEATALARDALHPGLIALFDWLERDPRPVDIPALRARFDDLSWHSFEAWTRAHADRLRALTTPGQLATRR